MQVNSWRFNGITPIDICRILWSPPHWIPRWSLRRIGDAWRYFPGFKVGASLLYHNFFAICCGLSQVKGTLAFFIGGGGSKISLWKISLIMHHSFFKLWKIFQFFSRRLFMAHQHFELAAIECSLCRTKLSKPGYLFFQNFLLILKSLIDLKNRRPQYKVGADI